MCGIVLRSVHVRWLSDHSKKEENKMNLQILFSVSPERAACDYPLASFSQKITDHDASGKNIATNRYVVVHQIFVASDKCNSQ